MPARTFPGSNELLDEISNTDASDDGGAAPEFADLVEEYGIAEASRRWMAIFAAFDATET